MQPMTVEVSVEAKFILRLIVSNPHRRYRWIIRTIVAGSRFVYGVTRSRLTVSRINSWTSVGWKNIRIDRA